MRTLLLFRGAPGSGKSTFIKENNLENYTLSPDSIRLMISSTMLGPSGKEGIRLHKDSIVWEFLYEMLEIRMKQGQFTVIDATNSKPSEAARYKILADKYKYRVYVIDLTDMPIDECKRRNTLRPSYKIVPNETIDRMYARFNEPLSNKFTKLKIDELDTIWYKSLSFDKYKKIHHIGDIHGCNTVLQEYLSNNLNDDECYIFCGDYLDRGCENVEVLQFLLSIYHMENVILLEGNHEIHLRNWSHGENVNSRDFVKSTQPELELANIRGLFTKKEVRKLCRSFAQSCYYSYQGKEILVTHGGISNMKGNLTFVATDQLIRGTGRYDEYEETISSFESNTPPNVFQISGHRNIHNVGIKASNRCFNLEGGVEHGGNLRVVTLDCNGFNTHEIENKIFNKEESMNFNSITNETVENVIKSLRQNQYIDEKKYGTISSFNFTRDAFDKKVWNDQTIRARGLFIDTSVNKVALRGYKKFFNINQTEDTNITNLKHKLSFPVHVYKKENGYLGLLSYHAESDQLLFATKSIVGINEVSSRMINGFKNIFYSSVAADKQLEIIEYLKHNDVTMVFEVIDIYNDPHIIEYENSKIVLLDIIENLLVCTKVAYKELSEISSKFGLECKELAISINTWGEFYDWFKLVNKPSYTYNDKYIEGFVIEDSDGFMVKVKLYFYNYWRKLRGVSMAVLLRGDIRDKAVLYDGKMNYYHQWIKLNRDIYSVVNSNGKRQALGNIIVWRRAFDKYMKENSNSNKDGKLL